VCFEISLFIECSLALLVWAYELFFSGMCFHVYLKSLDSTVGLVATLEVADELLYLEVGVHMVVQVTLGHERFAATWLLARKRPILYLF